MPFAEITQRQPRWLILTAALALVAVIGWIDYLTGFEVTVVVLYALPILLVVSKAGRGPGFVFAALCSVAWWLSQIDSHPYQTKAGFAMAVVSRLFYFCVFVIAVAAVKARREADLARIKTLERAQELEREILRTTEQEQQRIGRDLHDILGPQLAAIGYAVDFMAADLRDHKQVDVGKADEIRAMVGEALAIIRGLARGLFPVQVDGTGLAAALDDMAGTISRISGVSVCFYEKGDAEVCDQERGMHLYRIAQEAVNNAVKHAGAKKITIALGREEGVLSLVIADDGTGITSGMRGARGTGLHSMKYRARAVGGELTIDSGANQGTIVSCKIPDIPPRETPVI
jgi:signal transduction histidine kinase